MVNLYDYQLKALSQMKNGCILCGSVGSGKSRTGLAYYYTRQGGVVNTETFIPMVNPKKLYIITTAKKRDSLEWDSELPIFLIDRDNVTVDSWNNIGKYKDVTDAFFIFDEQRVVGTGAWVKAFLKIAKSNEWILLSATPGDSYSDYIPVFIANGFFRNKTEFISEHVVYSRFSKFPKIDRYINTGRLNRLRRNVLVNMDYKHDINTHKEIIFAEYDRDIYKEVMRKRWDPYKDEPIQQISGLCYILRRICNEDSSRCNAIMDIFQKHGKIIVFYNFDYERDILLDLAHSNNIEVTEWNGHKHQPIPNTSEWIYICQYTSACEGWECITTNCVVFYSLNYSYKVMTQAAGRIDRLNTPFTDLYYYYIKSRSGIDLAISRALDNKKKFNERSWIGDW